MLATATGSNVERLNFHPFMNIGIHGASVTHYQGTGRGYLVENMAKCIRFIESKTSPSRSFETFILDVMTNTSASNDIDIRSIVSHMENIRSVINPSMSELAKDLGVTRQAVYKWLAGESRPDDDMKMNYVKTLSLVADAFKEADITNSKILVKMKAFDGKSLMSLIKEGADWQGPVDLLIREAKIMNQATQAASEIQSKAAPTDTWQSSLSIPGSFTKE
ncbi:helix-turn-helix domain-containing protein [Klebsiella sp. R390]|uniref:helix-turn-helix domain-containing protein n=1 Tax=Klebsiella sp. R390 TaxID=2755400 RepID=UPI003DA9CD34